MKYLKKFNEASKAANEYKFRRDLLPADLEDILLPLKDEFINYHITFPTVDMKKVEIDLKALNNLINKYDIKDVIKHLNNYLYSESFELIYYSTDVKGIANGASIDFNFEYFFELMPNFFNQMHLCFIFTD